MDTYKTPHRKEIFLLAFLCLLLEATLIVSDVLTFKITSFFGIAFTIPALMYPLTYAIGDTLTEVYGRKITLTIFFIAIALEVIVALLISYAANVHDLYNPIYYTHFQYALGKMYLAATGVVVGSVLGFTTNTVIMYFLKTKFSYRSFPIRSICSSLTGELIFTITAFSIWFYSDSTVTSHEIFSLILSSSGLKLFFAIIYSIPAYWVAQKLAKNKIGIEKEALRIVDVSHMSEHAGHSVFAFQIVGKRTGFTARSGQVTMNMFYALNKSGQKLVEADLKGEIITELDNWAKTKHAN